MENRLKDNSGFIVYFNQVRWRRYLPDAHELESSLGLYAVSRASDGTIYTVK